MRIPQIICRILSEWGKSATVIHNLLNNVKLTYFWLQLLLFLLLLLSLHYRALLFKFNKILIYRIIWEGFSLMPNNTSSLQLIIDFLDKRWYFQRSRFLWLIDGLGRGILFHFDNGWSELVWHLVNFHGVLPVDVLPVFNGRLVHLQVVSLWMNLLPCTIYVVIVRFFNFDI